MNLKSLLLSVILTLASVAWAQTQSAPAPPAKDGPSQMDMEHHSKKNHKQQMKAMKADADKLEPFGPATAVAALRSRLQTSWCATSGLHSKRTGNRRRLRWQHYAHFY